MIWRICTAFNNDLYSVERSVLRWIICTTLNDLYYVYDFTALNDMYYVAWFAQRRIICTVLNYLKYSVELFVLCWINLYSLMIWLCWMICTTLNDFLLRCKICSTSNDLSSQGIIQRWKICTTLNDSQCGGWFVQRWIICTTINYWLSAFKWVPGVLIWENTVSYFALTSGLISKYQEYSALPHKLVI